MTNNLNDLKMLVFDIDDTLCDINSSISNSLARVILELSNYCQIVFASGKPSAYIAGFVRQIGIKNSIIIGENGATIMYGSTFPPKEFYKVNVPKEVNKYLKIIRKDFLKQFDNRIWFQPNDVNLTIFPINNLDIKEIHNFSKKYESTLINTYYHSDSIDYTPKGFDKGNAVSILLNKINIRKSNLYVFGNGSNDLSMLRLTNKNFLIKSNMKDIKPFASFDSYSNLEEYLNILLKEVTKYDK